MRIKLIALGIGIISSFAVQAQRTPRTVSEFVGRYQTADSSCMVSVFQNSETSSVGIRLVNNNRRLNENVDIRRADAVEDGRAFHAPRVNIYGNAEFLIRCQCRSAKAPLHSHSAWVSGWHHSFSSQSPER